MYLKVPVGNLSSPIHNSISFVGYGSLADDDYRIRFKYNEVLHLDDATRYLEHSKPLPGSLVTSSRPSKTRNASILLDALNNGSQEQPPRS